MTRLLARLRAFVLPGGAAPAAPARTAAQRPLFWAIGTYVAAVLLHVDRLPVWCTLIVLGVAFWRSVTLLRDRALPGTALRLALGALLLLAVIGQFSRISGLEAGTTLLASMGALKLLETRATRDEFVVLCVALFLVLAACLDRQSLLRLPLYVGVLWLICAALAVVATPGAQLSARTAFSVAGRALGFAMPIALLLFLTFPRVQGQIWALPSSGAAVTGLSNEMSPGAIGQLSESAEPAFRARFTGTPPRPQELYWRGPVLHSFDGYTWRREPGVFNRQNPLAYLGPAYHYRITLEPHRQNWWFALDMPQGATQPGVFFTWDYDLIAAQPVTQPTSYELVSHTQWRVTQPLSAPERRQALQLPAGRNRRSLAYARELRAAVPDEAAYVARVLTLFRDGNFAYTLTPPRLDLDSVDDFLFNTRLGFCGHFASAFVTLTRAAGIPSRVVTGYQGGEWNPLGGYFIVRQSDAHAWAEIWVEGRGWTRVDPTAVVAPERLQRGFFGRFADGLSQGDTLLGEIGWLSRPRLAWDTLNTWWKDQVIEFDLRSQLALLDRLGFEDPRIAQLGWLLAAGLGAWVLWIGLRFGRELPRRGVDPLGEAYRRLCRRLARIGLARAPHEGPRSYAERIARARPDLAAGITPLMADYARLRFGRECPPQAVRTLATAARRLPLRAARRAPRRSDPLPENWRELLNDRVRLYRQMPAPLRTELEPLLRSFLERVEFIGCNGLEVRDEMRLVVGAQACMLLLRQGPAALAPLHGVMLYPGEFVVEESDEDELTGVVTEGHRALSGQTVDTDRIVLSWPDVEDAQQRDDGYNVVIHEFAHFLDHASPAWSRALHATLDVEYAALCAAVDAGAQTLLDPYGAEDPAEFLAVASEAFMELPQDLRAEHPQLYAALVSAYGLDPACWEPAAD